MIRCPNCRSALHVEQDLPTDPITGKFSVFLPDATTYTCSRFGTRHDRGCGHQWDEVERCIREARAAIKAIPVTDATVNRRAQLLDQIDGLTESINISARKSA